MKKFKIMEKKKLFFSDKKIILKSIKLKNKFLSKNLKLNIIKEESNQKYLKIKLKIFQLIQKK
jgi:hypothetical protein